MRVIERRDAFERNPKRFIEKWTTEEAALQERILAARSALKSVKSPKKILRDCADLCISLGADGLRGELTLLRTSRALAAYEGATALERSHISSIAPLALSHRLRRDPLDEAGSSVRVQRAVCDILG